MPAEGRFEIVEGAQKGAVVPLAASPVTFGRAPGNGFVVKDATVSRQHAKVFERDERHFIADLNSSHGTFVNGLKVTLHSLTPGDVVKLGGTTLRYFVGAAAPDAAPPAAPSAAPPVASAPAPIAAPGGDAFELELELPTVMDARPPAAPPKAPASPPPPAPAKPLPPVNPNYRRALAATGEDPFADDAPPSAPEAGAAAAAAPPAPAAPAMSVMPSIELRGRTAEQFATRGGATAGGAARPATGAAAVHVPPPLARLGRSKGPLGFLRGDLDQRDGFARLVAAIFALAIAGGLLWGTMKLFGSGPAKEAPRDDPAPLGPERPSLPPKR